MHSPRPIVLIETQSLGQKKGSYFRTLDFEQVFIIG